MAPTIVEVGATGRDLAPNVDGDDGVRAALDRIPGQGVLGEGPKMLKPTICRRHAGQPAVGIEMEHEAAVRADQPVHGAGIERAGILRSTGSSSSGVPQGRLGPEGEVFRV
ncbi:MAG: hypothetical protein M3066_05425 [Actinomycetota bacterium]|nr:hypothetical protein [Actinomycetota bacterium]